MVHFNVSLRPALMMRRVNRPKSFLLFFFNFLFPPQSAHQFSRPSQTQNAAGPSVNSAFTK